MTKAPRFTVYHVASTMASKSFYFEHHARALVAKLNAREARYYNDPERKAAAATAYAYATVEHYRTKIVHMVTKRNMMSGLEYEEPSNTPGYLSPSSETYWST
jgi:flagellum-specific peptidoglycan hydrolase FlgJ